MKRLQTGCERAFNDSNIYYVEESETFFVSADSLGFESELVEFNIEAFPLPVTSISGNFPWLSVKSIDSASYTWYYNNSSRPEDSSAFLVNNAGNGSYFVIVTDSNECMYETDYFFADFGADYIIEDIVTPV